jgi:hypothetical protein
MSSPVDERTNTHPLPFSWVAFRCGRWYVGQVQSVNVMILSFKS